MTPAPISVERYTVTGDIAYPIHEDTNGEYVRHSDYAALLHQLAERDAEVDRLLRGVREMSGRFNEAASDLRAAERAREEACGLLRDVIAWRRTVPIAETPNRKDGGIFGRIAAFLAASGGA